MCKSAGRRPLTWRERKRKGRISFQVATTQARVTTLRDANARRDGVPQVAAGEARAERMTAWLIFSGRQSL